MSKVIIFCLFLIFVLIFTNFVLENFKVFISKKRAYFEVECLIFISNVNNVLIFISISRKCADVPGNVQQKPGCILIEH